VDLEALQVLLPRYDGYVGLVGSRTKAQEMRTRLEQAGLDPALMDRVHCPIGLAIGAETAAEVATAIAAELVQRIRQPAG
jgi:xanthine dehydrogenase accessory factor